MYKSPKKNNSRLFSFQEKNASFPFRALMQGERAKTFFGTTHLIGYRRRESNTKGKSHIPYVLLPSALRPWIFFLQIPQIWGPWNSWHTQCDFFRNHLPPFASLFVLAVSPPRNLSVCQQSDFFEKSYTPRGNRYGSIKLFLRLDACSRIFRPTPTKEHSRC